MNLPSTFPITLGNSAQNLVKGVFYYRLTGEPVENQMQYFMYSDGSIFQHVGSEDFNVTETVGWKAVIDTPPLGE